MEEPSGLTLRWPLPSLGWQRYFMATIIAVFICAWTAIGIGNANHPQGWYRTLREDPQGAIKIAEREVRFRAVFTCSESLKAEVDQAYLAKYGTGGSIKYARGLADAERRATTTELVPG